MGNILHLFALMEILHLLVAGILVGLATYTSASYLVNERGPYAVLEKIRLLAPVGSELDHWMACPICQAPAWALFYTVAATAAGVILPGSVSGGALVWLVGIAVSLRWSVSR